MRHKLPSCASPPLPFISNLSGEIKRLIMKYLRHTACWCCGLDATWIFIFGERFKDKMCTGKCKNWVLPLSLWIVVSQLVSVFSFGVLQLGPFVWLFESLCIIVISNLVRFIFDVDLLLMRSIRWWPLFWSVILVVNLEQITKLLSSQSPSP